MCPSDPAPGDLVAGQVDVLFGTIIASIEYVKAGTLRTLAVTSAPRPEALPGIPTVDETLSGYGTTLWGGIAAPKTTPRKSSASSTRKLTLDLLTPS